jgi:hypothetical protein
MTNRLCSLRALLLCLLFGFLSGCGPSGQVTTDAGGKEPARPPSAAATNGTSPAATTPIAPTQAEEPAAPAPKPATLAEVRQAVDWLTFPKPENSLWEETNLTDSSYWMKGTLDQAVDSYRKIFTAQGWAEEKASRPDPQPNKYRSLAFTKAGFLVTINLEGKTESVKVYLNHTGNVDARRFPLPTDAKMIHAERSSVMFGTASAPEAVMEFCRKEIGALGWREVREPQAKTKEKPIHWNLRFVWNAMELGVTVHANKEGGTEMVRYWTSIRGEFDPADTAANLTVKEIPQPATIAETVVLLDLRKLPRLGEMTPKTNTGLRLDYEAVAGVDKTVAFYRKTLTDQGWTLVPPLKDVFDEGALRFEKAGFFLSVNIEKRTNPASNVLISVNHHGNVDLRQLPYPPGAEVPYVRSIPIQTETVMHTLSVMCRTSATAEEVATFYRTELGKLGWSEQGKDLGFLWGDAYVKIYVHTTRDGQTPVQVSTGWRDK